MIDVEYFLKESGWDYVNMKHHIPEVVIYQVRLYIGHAILTNQGDKPW